MSTRGNYSRYFIIIQEDERGYSVGDGKQTTGYAKLEKRNSKVKVSFFIQNLKKLQEPYYAVLVGTEKKKKLLKLNKVSLDDHGRGEVKLEYEENNIAYAHMTMEDIKGAAIVKLVDQNIISVLCGAVGENLPDDWKTYIVAEGKERGEKIEKPKHEEKVEENKEVKEDKEEIIEEIKESNLEEENKQSEPQQNRHDKDDKDVKDKENENKEDYSIFDEYEKDIEKNKKDKDSPEEVKGIDDDDFYKGPTEKFLQKIASGYEECDDFAISIGNSKLYKIYFEEMSCVDKDKDYNKYSIVYYPMMTYYEYIKKCSYFLFGFKKDKKNKIQYMVYAIPGKNTMNDQPFGGTTGFVTWVPKKNSSDKKETMGYWLMFYDFKHSCVVIPIK